jgi:hypothetical protein
MSDFDDERSDVLLHAAIGPRDRAAPPTNRLAAAVRAAGQAALTATATAAGACSLDDASATRPDENVGGIA